MSLLCSSRLFSERKPPRISRRIRCPRSAAGAAPKSDLAISVCRIVGAKLIDRLIQAFLAPAFLLELFAFNQATQVLD